MSNPSPYRPADNARAALALPDAGATYGLRDGLRCSRLPGGAGRTDEALAIRTKHGRPCTRAIIRRAGSRSSFRSQPSIIKPMTLGRALKSSKLQKRRRARRAGRSSPASCAQLSCLAPGRYGPVRGGLDKPSTKGSPTLNGTGRTGLSRFETSRGRQMLQMGQLSEAGGRTRGTLQRGRGALGCQRP